jgi:hypothetical protein
MSTGNRRAAAAALIGVLASGIPVAGASADANHGGSGPPGVGGSAQGGPPIATGLTPPATAAPGAGGATPPSVPPVPAIPPASLPPVPAVPPTATDPPAPSSDPPVATPCGQLTFTVPLPAVITCGPVTIIFNTVTTTTTTTTVAAPITAANGPITTPSPTVAVSGTKSSSHPRRKHRRASARRGRRTVLYLPVTGRRAAMARVHSAPSTSR